MCVLGKQCPPEGPGRRVSRSVGEDGMLAKLQFLFVVGHVNRRHSKPGYFYSTYHQETSTRSPCKEIVPMKVKSSQSWAEKISPGCSCNGRSSLLISLSAAASHWRYFEGPKHTMDTIKIARGNCQPMTGEKSDRQRRIALMQRAFSVLEKHGI